LKQISSNSQFCSTSHTTTKQDKCPNPLSFDILTEYTKSLSSWKLNIPVRKKNFFFYKKKQIFIFCYKYRYYPMQVTRILLKKSKIVLIKALLVPIYGRFINP
jgi:hypothetical protein